MVVKFDFLDTFEPFGFNYPESCSDISSNDLREYYQLLSQIDSLIEANDRNLPSLEILRIILNQILEIDIPLHNEITYFKKGSTVVSEKETQAKKAICKNAYSSIFFILNCIKIQTKNLLHTSRIMNEVVNSYERQRNENQNLTDITQLLETELERYCTTVFPLVSTSIVTRYSTLKEIINMDIENLKNGKAEQKRKQTIINGLNQSLNISQSDFIRKLIFRERDLRDRLSDFIEINARPIEEINNHHHEGVAFEIHNYFDSLDTQKIKSEMSEYIEKHEINKTIEDNITFNLKHLKIDNIFDPLLVFIEHNNKFNSEEKKTFKKKINTLKSRIITTDTFKRHTILLLNTIQFVCRTDDDFIEEYIRIYIKDCFEAYTTSRQEEDSGLSCSKGITERILGSVGAVIQNFCLIEDEKILVKKCPPIFKKLDKLFNKKLIDVIQEWSDKYLEGGESHEDLVKLKESRVKDAVKNHLIEFINKSYSNIISEKLKKQIDDELQKYEDMGVFDNLYFGGKRSSKRRTSKKRTTRKNKTQKRKNRKQ